MICSFISRFRYILDFRTCFLSSALHSSLSQGGTLACNTCLEFQLCSVNDHFERLRLASEQICRMSLLPDCIEKRWGDGILCQASMYFTVKDECGIFFWD